MEALGFICAVTICCLIVAITNWWDNRKEKEREASLHQDAAVRKMMTEPLNESMKVVREVMEQTKGTQDLFLETLTKIGCQYSADDEDKERFYFAYQGENFAVDMNNERQYVNLWDMFWASVELYDIDQLARLKKVINESNLRFATTTVYTVNEAGSTVDVHCKSVILFCAQIPDLETYLRAELNDFFHVHQYINAEMAKLKEQEEARV